MLTETPVTRLIALNASLTISMMITEPPDDSNFSTELLSPAPNCGIWANPGYGDFATSIFGGGEDLGYKASEGWKINDTNSAGPWIQSGKVKLLAALTKALSRLGLDGKNPKGFILDNCADKCPCGYFKSSFFARPDIDDYHFHQYHSTHDIWSEKEGPKNAPGFVLGDPAVDDGGGYLVACYCLQGSERHVQAVDV